MIEPTVSHIEFFRSKLFSNSSGSGLHGCGLSHSPGAILQVNLPFKAPESPNRRFFDIASLQVNSVYGSFSEI